MKKKLIYLYCILYFVTNFGNPTRTLYELFPIDIWKVVASHLEFNDKASIYFLAPRIGISEIQSNQIANSITLSYLKKSETLEDEILYLARCLEKIFKTSAVTSNARKLVVKKLEDKIKQLLALLSVVKQNDTEKLNEFLYKKFVANKMDQTFFAKKNNQDKLLQLKQNIQTEAKILEFILKESKNRHELLKKTFKFKNICVALGCFYLIIEMLYFVSSEFGANFFEEILSLRKLFLAVFITSYLFPEIIHEQPFENNYLFFDCMLNSESCESSEIITTIEDKFMSMKNIISKHRFKLLKIIFNIRT